MTWKSQQYPPLTAAVTAEGFVGQAPRTWLAYRKYPMNAGYYFHCFSSNRPYFAHEEIAMESGLKSGQARIQRWGQCDAGSCLPHHLTLLPLNYRPEDIFRSALLQQETLKGDLKFFLPAYVNNWMTKTADREHHK